MNRKMVIIVLAGLLVLAVAIVRRPPSTPPKQTEPLAARRVPKPRLPAPRMSTRAALLEAPAENLQPTNAFARLLNNDGSPPELRRAQIEVYLAANRRSAESLLTAFRLTGDRALLQEASEKHPNDPRVNYAAWSAARLDDASSPEAGC